MIHGQLLLTVICTAAGFNIFTNPVKHFQNGDPLFGQTTIKSKDGVFVTSPNDGTVLKCTLKGNCSEVNMKATITKGRKPIVSAANNLSGETDQFLVCQQVLTKSAVTEKLNGQCTYLSHLQKQEQIHPAKLVLEQMKKNSTLSSNNNRSHDRQITVDSDQQMRGEIHNNNNNNNKDDGDNDDDDDEDAGTEIAFVLDGSGSIDAEDFGRAKDFIHDIMKNVWGTCFSCNFAIVQYGMHIRTELLLLENKNATEALIKVKNIEQMYNYTKTASAINHVLEHVFVAENGSKENSKKIIIVLSDGRIFLDTMNLTDVMKKPQMKSITRFAVGVGKDVLNDSRAIKDMTEIASEPVEKHFFKIDNYAGLKGILSLLEKSITGIEGIQQGAGFLFELAEAGFSSHFALDGSLLFGAVGAYDWSGGIILKKEDTVKFLNASSDDHRFSYLGYSMVSSVESTGTLYISGAPRHNLTGGVFVFSGTSHHLQQILLGDQLGSYFGSVLCALDVDRDQKTDYLLVGAPYFHQKGEEGKVLVYKLHQGRFLKEIWEWQGSDKYTFARFGSAIANVGDIDGNNFNDVAVGAPLEGDSTIGSSGSIYIYNGFKDGINQRFSQRISVADVGMQLRYFGQSVSAMSDPGKERQQYISVGSQGNVTVFQTIPVIAFNPKVTPDPKVIAMSDQINKKSNKLKIKLDICFNTLKGSLKSGELPILFHIDLDAGRDKKRLTFVDGQERKGTFILTSSLNCLPSISLNFLGCFDCFSPMEVKLNWTLPSNSAGIPLRVLDAFNPTKFTEKITFEKECEEEKCEAIISLSDPKLSTNMIIIGFTQSLSIAFNLVNTGYGSYMTTLILTYPNILRFNKFSQKREGSVCYNEVKDQISQLKCNILHPVFKRNAQANFSISWQLVNRKSDTSTAEISANLTSGNGGTLVLDADTYRFKVKHALKVQLTGTADPPRLKMTEDQRDGKKKLTFQFQLDGENKHNATLNVFINITQHTRHTVVYIKSVTPKEDCATPLINNGEYHIRCEIVQLQEITIEAEVLISDVQDKSEKIIAEAKFSFNTATYEAMEGRQRERVEVDITKLTVVKSTGAIIGGSIGGFLLLAIIIVILVKCGFFRRRHQVDSA